MKEITELDMDKYLVLKREDIKSALDSKSERILIGLSGCVIEWERHHSIQNKYLVLNLDDEINLDYFGDNVFGDEFDENQKIKVKDIAVTIVNAIKKAKERN